MTVHSKVRTVTLLAFTCATVYGATSPGTDTLRRYLNRNQDSCRETDQNIRVEIEASLPKLKKEGSMSGLKVISKSGQVAYRFLRFTGDKLVKSDVILRYLTAEAQPRERIGNVGTNLENYKFRYLKTVEDGDSTVQVYRVTPRKKRVGLYKGELWLDAESAAPVREVGELVKSPSIFIRRVQFVRDYPQDDPQRASCGQAERMSINVQTILVGEADLVVRQHPAENVIDDSLEEAPAAGGVGSSLN